MNLAYFHRSMFLLWVPCLAVCACLAASTSSIGQDADPEIRGLNIALEARVRGEGFGDFTARQTMRTHAFWFITFGHVCSTILFATLTVPLAPMSTDQGLSLRAAAYVFRAIAL